MLKYKIGDLIEAAKSGEVNVIAHGCNCFCTMKSGIAPLIAKAFPEALEADLETEKGDIAKLGTLSVAANDDYSDTVHIYNLYTQFGYWGRNKGLRDLDYPAMLKSFTEMTEDLVSFDSPVKVGLPLIGAGLAGGDWDVIEALINQTLVEAGVDVTIYKLK